MSRTGGFTPRLQCLLQSSMGQTRSPEPGQLTSGQRPCPHPSCSHFRGGCRIWDQTGRVHN